MQILSLLYDAVALVTNSSLVWPYCTLVSKKSDIKALTKYEQPTIKKDARRKSLFVFSRSYFVRALGLLLLIGGANGNFVFEFEVKIFCEMKRKSVMPNGFKYSWKKTQHSSYVLDNI